MSGQDDLGRTENEPCGREECLANLVRIRDLQKNRDELWARLVDLSKTETELAEQVKSLECIIVSRSKRIEELEHQVKSYNEELYTVTRCHEQCKPNLEAEKQRNESEKVDLEGEIAALLETNTKLLCRLAGDRQSVSEHTRISAPASLQSLSRDNDEDQADTSPPCPGSVATPESEANELRPSLQAELMLVNSSDASEIDWWDQGSSAEDNDLIPSHDEYNEMARQDAMGRLPDDGALTEAASLTQPMELSSNIVVHKESALEVDRNCCNSCVRCKLQTRHGRRRRRLKWKNTLLARPRWTTQEGCPQLGLPGVKLRCGHEDFIDIADRLPFATTTIPDRQTAEKAVVGKWDLRSSSNSCLSPNITHEFGDPGRCWCSPSTKSHLAVPEPNDSGSLADQHTSNEHTTKIRHPDNRSNFEGAPHSHYRFRIAENGRDGEEGWTRNLEYHPRSHDSAHVSLESLHSCAFRHELVDIVAVVAVCANRDEDESSVRIFLKDESRIEAPSVAAVIYRSHVAALPEARVGDCILLKSFAVCFDGKKIPYIESIGSSAWYVWGGAGAPACHEYSIQVSNVQSKQMQRLYKWWQSQSNTTPFV